MSALAADHGNAIASLVSDGHLTREDVAPSLDGALAGERASRIFAVSLAEHGVAATLSDLIEARSLLGLPASSWALTPASVPRARSARRRTPSDLRRNGARYEARLSRISSLSAA